MRILVVEDEKRLHRIISEALEDCSGAIPYMEFFLSSGSRSRLLGRLSDGTLDIALLRETDPRELPPECRVEQLLSE